FNRDGIVDMAVSNYETNDVSILLGKGDGTFQAARRFPVVTPWFITTAPMTYLFCTAMGEQGLLMDPRRELSLRRPLANPYRSRSAISTEI
ncbi:MAG: VCBS repeat-containing protein, partial [Acidobacteria bacterium]|nr:VCBS repeat-containing protein [Acidobacteriota bacterium]MBI3656556.1 VCBS repeat-containing protein [Acidobacteriota bacterium]